MNKDLFNSLFEDKINNINKIFDDKWLLLKNNDDYEQEWKKYENTCNQIYQMTNYLYNPFFWFLIFIISIPLIFPMLIFVKKYKIRSKEINRLGKEKEMLIEKISSYNKEIISSYIFDEYFEAIFNLLEYQEIGPINKEIINYLNIKGLFHQENEINKTPWSGTWGIFRNNKIVLNTSFQEIEISEKEIQNFKNKKLNNLFNNKPLINIENKKWAYMNECEKLEFCFLGFKNKMILSKESLPKLENKTFEETFHWKVNDQIQFRMIFTPLMQERYIKDFVYRNINNVENEDKYLKIRNFFTNEYTNRGKNILYFETQKLFQEFLEKNEIKNIKLLIEKYQSIVLRVVKEQYDSMKFLYMIPFFDSLNQKKEIQKITSFKNKFEESQIFYILSSIIKKIFFIKDIEPFYILESKKVDKDICISDIKILSYEKKPYGKDDYEYIPHTKMLPLLYTFIENNSDFYRPFEVGQYIEKPKLKNKEVIKLIISASNENIDIYIQNNFLVATLKDINRNVSIDLLYEYCKKIKDAYSK